MILDHFFKCHATKSSLIDKVHRSPTVGESASNSQVFFWVGI
jgi:hypothetical protein